MEKLVTFLIIAFVLLRIRMFGKYLRKIPVLGYQMETLADNIGKYLRVINTLVHEVGHALFALLTGGKVDKIELFANTEGLAWTQSRFWLGRVLTTMAGYPFASFISFLFLYYLSNQKYLSIIIILLTILIIAIILWVRNFYGFLWCISFGFIFYYIYQLNNAFYIETVLYFITAVLFMESLYSAFVILKLSFTRPKDAGDATSLARTTLIIPAFVWGLAFFAQAVFFAYMGIQQFM